MLGTILKSTTKKTDRIFLLLKTAAVVVFLFTAAVQTQAGGATLTVTKTADTNDGVCNADCSLREAIAAAAAGAGIVFSSLFDSPQTITLSLGALVINRTVVIEGKGARLLTISGNNASRVFHINGPAGATSVNIWNLTVANGSVTGTERGGGILVESGNRLDLMSVTIRNNNAYNGGGIFTNGELNIYASTLTGNAAQDGAGIRIVEGIVNISNTTITANIANNSSGGIFLSTGTLTLNNTTITHNRAWNITGVSPPGGVGNISGTVYIRNTIIAANIGINVDVGGSFISRGNNLIGNNRGATVSFPAGNPNANGDRVGTNSAPLDARLGELQNNGGPTDTRAFLPDSPARNNGNNCVTNSSCPTNNPWTSLPNDQRGSGFTRQRDATVDIGAFELETATVTNTNDTGAGSLRAAAGSVGAGAAIAFNFAGCGVCTINLTSGELVVNKSLTILGTGARSLIIRRSAAQGTPNFRVFNVTGSGSALSLYNLTVAGGNPAANAGGILVNSGSELNLTESAVTNNTGSVGGGILNLGNLRMTRSTISHNLATNDSGGLRNNGAAVIINSTFSNNTSLNNGGGIVDLGTLTLINSTISGNTGNVAGGIFKNSGGELNILNTIIAANISGNGDPRPDVFGTFTSRGYNLIGNNNGAATSFPAGVPNENFDRVGTSGAPINPLLSELQNNGGGTDTRMPLLGSPAISNASVCVLTASCGTFEMGFPITTDQRGPGFPRAISTFVDIGAFELRIDTVSNTADGGAGSLRQIIANTPPGSIINFNYSDSTPGCAAGVCTINLTSGSLAINKSLTIIGPGARNLIIGRSTAGTPGFRVFYLTGGATFNFSGLTVAGGSGGIFIDSSQLNLNGVVIRDNHVRDAGGGILAISSTVNILNCAIVNNSALFENFNFQEPLLGFGFSGGGVFNASGTLNIANTTISGNVAEDLGGGIGNSIGPLILNNVTISHNQTMSSGGGVHNFGGSAGLRNTIIAKNIDTSTANLSPDIQGNFISLGNNLIGNNAGGTGFTNGVNGDIVGTNAAPVDPLLGDLRNNGGQTDTRALKPNSPALNKGNNCVTNLSCSSGNPPFALTTDQRGSGFTRSLGGTVDIGAFEGFVNPVRAPFDFDGDGKTDVSVFRPSDGSWWYSRSSDNQFRVYAFGVASDIITPGDYTGDGRADIAVFRPSSGEWFIQRSEDNSFFSFPFGQAGDIPAPSDFDGDGKTDAAVFRPASATWFILNSGGGTTFVQFGSAEDKPVPADFDGDGRTDIAVFRPSDGSWWYLQSSNSQFRVYRFGVSTDKPVQGDFTGDGKADIAVFRPSTGEWFVQRSEDNSFYSFPFGQAGDLAAPGDYDGDGRADAAVFRPSTANWFVQRSTAGILITTFGANGDRPVPNAFVP